MGYVRRLRLAQAARLLANGAPDILQVALAAGYGSHEAFTRAFREHFGQTPEAVRAGRSVATLDLMEPLTMTAARKTILPPPRFEQGKPLDIAGISATYTFDSLAGIPLQWQRFGPHLGHVPGQIGGFAYGVAHNMTDDGFDYLAGVAVKDRTLVPSELMTLHVPAQHYAVFRHDGHVSEIRDVMSAIWNDGLSKTGRRPSGGPCLERYGPEFNGRTGEGGFEILISVEP
jgi:AraC family transcriptional regulator